MTGTLTRASARHGLRHPAQVALSVLGIALGVAVVVAIDLAVESARRAFELSNEAVLGRATHQVLSGPSGLPESLFTRLRLELAEVPAAPVVERYARTIGEPAETLLLMGVDVFSEWPFRDHVEGARTAATALVPAMLTTPRGVLIGERTAARLGVGEGDALPLRVAGRTLELRIVGLIAQGEGLADASLDDLVLGDIATVQNALERPGLVNRIDLIVPEAGGALDRVESMLPPGARLEPAGGRTRVAVQMTRAFNLNLFMLSLLALVVGLFLIYNTMTFSVVQRWRLLGDLRTLGVTRGEIARLIVVEAAVIGAVASVLGVALGVALATQLVDLVARTVNDLYFQVSVRSLHVSPLSLALGVVLGCLAAVAAAVLPALEASRAPPSVARLRSYPEVSMGRRLPWLTAVGAGWLVLAVALLGVPGRSIVVGFAALFSVVFGFALLAPAATAGAVRLLGATGRAGRVGTLAVRGVSASLSRTSVAIAALMVALSATVGVGVMVDSFRHSVVRWLDATLRADLYVAAPGGDADRALDPALMATVAALPEVVAMSSGRRTRVDAGSGVVDLLVLSMAPASYDGFDLIDGPPDRQAWRAFDVEDAVLVSEPFAWRHEVAPGDELTLATDAGAHRFRVAAVYRDYGSERGTVLISRPVFERHWSDRRISTIGLYLAPGVEPAEVARRVEGLFSARQVVQVSSNRDIKSMSVAIFDRTFTITSVLRLLAMLIAVVGILSALMALELERAREVAVLRAQGLTRGQVWGLVEIQTGVMGLVAAILAVPLGLLLALMLVHVINRRSFGWGMSLHVDPAILGQAVLAAVAAALVAGVYPAWRMASTAPAAGLREE